LGVTAASQVSRNPVVEVYTQGIADLVSAESLLAADNGFFANKYSAAALLARIYLPQGRLADAAGAANRVLNGGVPADLSLNAISNRPGDQCGHSVEFTPFGLSHSAARNQRQPNPGEG